MKGRTMSDKPKGWSTVGVTSLLLFLFGLLAVFGGAVLVSIGISSGLKIGIVGANVGGLGLLSLFCSGLLAAINNIALALLQKGDKSE